MTDTARHISLEGTSNLRDIGGYQAADGRQVRWRTIYRSGAMFRLTKRDWQWLAERGILAVCDLRSDAERALAPTQWQAGEDTRHVGDAYNAEIIFSSLLDYDRTAGIGVMGSSLYPKFPTLLAPSFKVMFKTLLEGHAPLIVHCSAGQDRTGLAIGLLLSALGVPRQTIFEDYLLSTRFRRTENEIDREAMAGLAEDNVVARFYVDLLKRRGAKAFLPRPLINRDGQPLLSDAFSAIEAEWGSVASYLEEVLGVGSDAVDHLRESYLVQAGDLDG